MATNISKYCQLNDFLLLEYEFNRDGSTTELSTPFVSNSSLGFTIFHEGDDALGITNNILALNSVPTNAERTFWGTDASTPWITYPFYWDSSENISTSSYPLDTVKVHIVSGYSFDDTGGFLLQIRAEDNSTNLVDLTNFTYIKQPQTLGRDVVKFSANTLFLGNRFYDKYIELKIPSIQQLGSYKTNDLETILNIKLASDVFVTYSGIFNIVDNGEFDQYNIDEQINVQLPVTSAADNFNCFIAESTDGDYIEYFGMWGNTIIGDYMGDIESGRIQLYTSNNPNDNAEDFSNQYGLGAAKWVLIHEISVFEHIPGGTSLLTQSYSFTQTNNFSIPNYFRPILRNADIDSSYSIQYTCRLMNRMDGTQIIRKASFSSTDPKKYGLWFTRLNVENLIPFKVFNRIEAEKPNINMNAGVDKIKYVKVFFDTVSVVLNYANEVFPQGTGPLFLKAFDSVYKFKFGKIDVNGNNVNVDLSGAYNYALVFKLDDKTKIEVGPTYSTNMNTTIGEIEFKLTEDQLTILAAQTNNDYSIVVKNPNGTEYTFYEGIFYPLSDENAVITNYESMFTVTDLQAQVADLQAEVNDLTAKNAALEEK